MSPQSGWYADPTERFAYRWWDGSTWTEHVRDERGREQFDSVQARIEAAKRVSGTSSTPRVLPAVRADSVRGQTASPASLTVAGDAGGLTSGLLETALRDARAAGGRTPAEQQAPDTTAAFESVDGDAAAIDESQTRDTDADDTTDDDTTADDTTADDTTDEDTTAADGAADDEAADDAAADDAADEGSAAAADEHTPFEPFHLLDELDDGDIEFSFDDWLPPDTETDAEAEAETVDPEASESESTQANAPDSGHDAVDAAPESTGDAADRDEPVEKLSDEAEAVVQHLHDRVEPTAAIREVPQPAELSGEAKDEADAVLDRVRSTLKNGTEEAGSPAISPAAERAVAAASALLRRARGEAEDPTGVQSSPPRTGAPAADTTEVLQEVEATVEQWVQEEGNDDPDETVHVDATEYREGVPLHEDVETPPAIRQAHTEAVEGKRAIPMSVALPILILTALACLGGIVVLAGSQEPAVPSRSAEVAFARGQCRGSSADSGMTGSGFNLRLTDLTRCTDPHLIEIYGTLDVSEDYVSFPGSAVLEQRTASLCTTLFQPAAGGVPLESADMGVTALWPSFQRWRQGDTQLVCYVVAPEGAALTDRLALHNRGLVGSWDE